MIGMVAALAMGWLAFGVAPSGDLSAVLLAAALGLTAFLALGYTLAGIYPSSGAPPGGARYGSGSLLRMDRFCEAPFVAGRLLFQDHR